MSSPRRNPRSRSPRLRRRPISSLLPNENILLRPGGAVSRRRRSPHSQRHSLRHSLRHDDENDPYNTISIDRLLRMLYSSISLYNQLRQQYVATTNTRSAPLQLQPNTLVQLMRIEVPHQRIRSDRRFLTQLIEHVKTETARVRRDILHESRRRHCAELRRRQKNRLQ